MILISVSTKQRLEQVAHRFNLPSIHAVVRRALYAIANPKILHALEPEDDDSQQVSEGIVLTPLLSQEFNQFVTFSGTTDVDKAIHKLMKLVLPYE